MRVTLDREGDVLYIVFNDKKHHRGEMIHDDVIITYDEDGTPVAIEILAASQHVKSPNVFDFTDITHPRFDMAKIQESK